MRRTNELRWRNASRARARGGEVRASLAVVGAQSLHLVRRYWHLELAFLIFNVASAKERALTSW